MRLTVPPRSTSLSALFILPLPLAVLVVAYLIAVSRRPAIPEAAQIENPHQWGFPKWYGHHATPYDYRVASTGQEEEVCDHPKNVVLFIELTDDSPHTPTALTLLSSLSTSNRFKVTPISTFSPNWDPDVSGKENLRRVGGEDADWIWRVGDHSRIDDLGCDQAVWVEEEMATPGRANLTLLSQPHHLLAPETSHSILKASFNDGWELGLFTHVLPAVSAEPDLKIQFRLILTYSQQAAPNLYYPSSRLASRRSVVYFPLSTTQSRDRPKLPWRSSWSIYSRSRRAIPRPTDGGNPFSSTSAWMQYWSKEEERLARAMRHAGICLFEGWEQGLLDDRIAKAMLSGCIVATVPPQASHDTFSQLIIPLEKSSPFELPVEQVKLSLSSTSESKLQHLALKAFIAARYHLVPSARLNAVGNAVKIWEDGGRGYDFKGGFRWDCESAYGPWCE
ncbi:uncharacterized protein IL334_002973 [Kwoniella shivajii]|uniref:Uncharacterized protein n=1 Tax=Kwoniella shivajii TaxID=564305 RepID=A0ABZ1CW87_9TREE|nr:hypothetical protein IL334_002973 [Kwoniella shivajii]